MGLTANVYRTGTLLPNGLMKPRDCTLDGWSSRFDRVCIVNINGPFEPSEDCPAVMLLRHRTMPALHVVSVEHHEAKRWTMTGGNFLHCSDSRFSEACNNIMVHGNGWPHTTDGRYRAHEHMSFGAVAIHDRIEG